MKIGDYVRTKKRGFQFPQIARIKSMSKDSGYKNQYFIELDHNLLPYYEFYIYEEDIDKSSPDIIDLIEVGDYVNGEEVVDVIIDNDMSRVKSIDGTYFNNDIKSIVTKEQFESMEYKVKE